MTDDDLEAMSLLKAVLRHREEERERLLRSSPAEVAAVSDNWSPGGRGKTMRRLPQKANSLGGGEKMDATEAAWRQRPEGT